MQRQRPKTTTTKSPFNDSKEQAQIIGNKIVELGWGPHFAAATVLEKLRNHTGSPYDLNSAIWYYEQLAVNSRKEQEVTEAWGRPWTAALTVLFKLLNPDELTIVVEPLKAKYPEWAKPKGRK